MYTVFKMLSLTAVVSSVLPVLDLAQALALQGNVDLTTNGPDSIQRNSSLSAIDLSNNGNDVHNSSVSIGFVHGFIASSAVIVVSEIADKTFFIAAIMAMKHSRLAVFCGAILALATMSVLSVGFGWAATVIPRVYTHYISTALFVIFGLKMLIEGYRMSATGGQEEFEEVQSDLKRREAEIEGEEKEENQRSPEIRKDALISKNDGKCTEKDVAKGSAKNSVSCLKVSRVIVQAFTLTFLAEWGDRSQLATIILAARENMYGVAIGSIFGHSVCTGLAVLSGKYLAEKISVRSVTILGGIVFLIFAVTALVFGPDED